MDGNIHVAVTVAIEGQVNRVSRHFEMDEHEMPSSRPG